MQSRRNEAATNDFFHKYLNPQGFAPGVLITNELNSYGAVQIKILKGMEHRQCRRLNNRAEKFHRLMGVR